MEEFSSHRHGHAEDEAVSGGSGPWAYMGPETYTSSSYITDSDLEEEPLCGYVGHPTWLHSSFPSCQEGGS